MIRQTSMATLIMWNISKAVKTNPVLNLKSAIQATQERLLCDNSDADSNQTQNPEDQYLSCAILAWQQLGHSGTDSLHEYAIAYHHQPLRRFADRSTLISVLWQQATVSNKLKKLLVLVIDNTYKFIEAKRKENEKAEEKRRDNEKAIEIKKNVPLSPGSFISYNDPKFSNEFGSINYDTVGPVFKLPAETKIVMRCDKNPTRNSPTDKAKCNKEVKNKIDAACCMESACMNRLANLDKATNELRTRAQNLAKREAQRVEMLERAEAAWKDLERGYQRRLSAAEEKEQDMIRSVKKLIEERNGYKDACSTLAVQLRERANTAEKERVVLSELEKEVCNHACIRLRYSEDAGRLDSELAELQCKNTQLDRELQFKEEQIRGKLQNMENEIDCARALTHEAERTIHAELSALKDQVNVVSEQLLQEDKDNGLIRAELTQLRQEKQEVVDDLEGCQVLCSGRAQKKLDELNMKREKLRELKDKVTECKCKLPIDEAIEVKRTASLVALCKCAPEDKLSETCSCTSLRTTLLINLLMDLFGGLQSELGGSGSQMPCQLLKCLEDKHNWDKASVIKTNLRKHFSQLLVGELDIAIATSIEKYHARWVGASCADAVRKLPSECGASPSECPERVIERRAQKLATKLAERLFKERADQLTAKAKEVLKSGPPPCECSGRSAAAVYPCFVKTPRMNSGQAGSSGSATQAYWRRTHQDVSHLKMQLEDLKKASINKEDLKMMEENIVKIVQRSVPEPAMGTNGSKQVQKKNTIKKAIIPIHRSVNTDEDEMRNKYVPFPKLSSIKKKQIDLNPKRANKNFLLGLQMDKPVKPFKKLGNSYAVNLCLCGSRRDAKKSRQHSKQDSINLKHTESKKSFKGLAIKDIIPKTSSIRQTKPIVANLHSDEIYNGKKNKTARSHCRSDAACFHKLPSNTSIDKLLNTLAKWKCDLFKLNNKCDKNKIDDADDDIKDVDEKETSFEQNVSSQKQNRKNGGKPSEVLPKSVSMETSINNTDSYFAKQVTNASKGTDFHRDLPVNTESEYMGAINLEKSNENYCKCVIDNEKKSNFTYKCLNSAACDCNTNAKNKKDLYLPEKQQEQNLSPDLIIEPEERYTNTEKNKQASVTGYKKNTSIHDISDMLKISSSLSNDCEYIVKFLGVTLTNANSGKDFAEKEKTCCRVHQTTNGKNHRENMKKPDPWFHKDANTAVKCNGDDITFSNNLSSPQTQLASCECSSKYDEFKSLINNVFSKQRGDFCKNEDKSLDTRSLKKTGNLESCICCNNAKSDETKDLELNAFHLLEEHLRDKLEEFKNTTCKASCISYIEEEKLFATILQRVKEVISESAGNFTCKCIGEEPTEGSFQRAYILLQEYLKIKIKKVQCLCSSSRESKQLDLPAVMEKVRNLIEKDFQRLYNICKCKTSKDEIDNIHIELPERDTNNSNESNPARKIKNECIHEDKETSNQSIVVTQNISSQVSSNLKINTKTSKTLENYNNSLDDLEFHNERCTCTSSKKVTKSHVDFERKGFVVNQCLNVSKENVSASTNDIGSNRIKNLAVPEVKLEDDKDNLEKFDKSRKTQSPYIGYTVDCSCNGTLGTCSCTKSMITGNNDKINSIWNTLTSNKLHNKDHSYIMNAVPKTMPNIETESNKDSPVKVKEKPILCNTEISVHDDEEITLKDSVLKVNKTYITATTSDENLSWEVDETIDWVDSSSTKNKSQKRTDFSDNTYDNSLYYPIKKLMNRRRSEAFVKSEPIKVPTTLSLDCECNMVPMCHVKMLVENIEKKLIYSKCTCDAMCSQVCPVHSHRN